MNSLLDLDTLLSAVHGKILAEKKDCNFTNVTTDSRNVTACSLFVPLVGEMQDGHKYIPQAIEKGASVVLLNNSEYEKKSVEYDELAKNNPSVAFICVENTLHGLQDAAEAYVAKFPSLTKISITGSSGKTTTKEMTVAVMRAAFGEENIVYTKGNFNSETGLPLSVFQIKGTEKIGIFEMGMNRENEIGEISKVLKSKYGIITNIGNAHIGLLGSRENIAKEKRKSFDYIPSDGAAFVPAEDDFADYCTEKVLGKVVKYGKSVAEKSGVVFVKDLGLAGSCFSVDGVEVNLPLSGEYNYQNALAVVALANEMKISVDAIKNGLESLAAIAGRMEVRQIELNSGKKVSLIADCYNANPDSMGKVIEFCGKLSDSGKLIFVLGDMKELGSESESAHKEVGKKILNAKADFVYLVGAEMAVAYDYIKNDGTFENKACYFEENSDENFEEIAKSITEECDDGDVILLKGSHSVSLEKIIPLLVKQEDSRD